MDKIALSSLSSGSNVWVTGASSGLGLELAIQLANQGCRVFISARNHTKLKELADSHENLNAIAFDVTDKAQLVKVSEQIRAHTDSLQLVILNAGNCEYFDIEEPDWAMMERVMAVNYVGAINTITIALPFLQEYHAKVGQRSHIVGVSSMATVRPFPRAQAYGSSKAALSYFLQSMRLDLKQKGVDVSVVLPGFVKTPLTDKNDFEMPFIMTADEAAKRIIQGIKARPEVFAFPKRLYWILGFFQYFPKLWSYFISPKENGRGVKEQ